MQKINRECDKNEVIIFNMNYFFNINFKRYL